MLKSNNIVFFLTAFILSSGPNIFAKEGDILWQHPVGENIEASTTIDNEGNIYTTGGGFIFSFTSDGKLRWKTCALDGDCKGLEQGYPYALGVASSPAVSPDGTKVYITGYAGVFAFRTDDGSVLWKKLVFDDYYEFAEKDFEGQAKMWRKTASTGYPQMFATTPAISADGSRLYAGAGENDFPSDSFFCINAEDGSLVWEYIIPHPPQQESTPLTEVFPEEKHTRGYLGGASLGPDGTVYVASQHGWLISLTDNGDSFTENWAYNVGAEMRMPPAMDAEGFLYVGSSSAGGYIHKVDSHTGKKAPGKWPVKTYAGEVFAAIAIAADGTIYANSEDHRLWAFNPDGTVKWNNLEFEHWGGDPLIRADDTIIVTSQVNKAARVLCIRDEGDKGVIEWFSEPITTELAFNETNVNIGPNGDIYVTSGVESPHALFAIKGNGLGLSKTSPWPKYMGNIQNNGSSQNIQRKPSLKEGDILWHRPADDSVESTPAVDDQGNVYISGGSSVYSFALDGTHRWTTSVGEQAGEFNSPSLSPDQKVVYGGGVNYAYAIDTATGRIIWKNTDFEVGFHSVPAVSSDGSRLYFGVGAERDEGESFYCIDTSDGSVKWEYVMPHPPRGFHGYLGGAIIGPDGTVYIASQHGWLISLSDNGDSFTEIWAYDVKAEMRMPPSMDKDGYLYVGSSDAGGYVHKVDSRTGKSAGGNWPVKTTAGEVFAHISIGNDGTLYVNSEDRRLWAFNPDGTVKWNNLKFEMWGSDPLIRNDGRIIVGSQLDGAARVACIRDDGDFGVIEWTSEPIAKTLHLNETNVNIAPDGTIYITTGQPENAVGEGVKLYAIKGNGMGLSKTSPWPKYMGNIHNNGHSQNIQSKPALKDGSIKWSYKIRGVVTKGGLALGPDSTIYAGTSEGFVYAVKKDGSLKWELNLNPKTPFQNFPQYEGPLPPGIKKEEIPDSIILPDGVLQAENLSHSSPTLTEDGKKLYIGGINSGKVYCINTVKGSIEWEFDVRKIEEIKEDPLHMGGGFVSSPAIGADGTIYIGSGDWWGDQWVEAQQMGLNINKTLKRRFSDKRLYAINPNGTLKWFFELEPTDTFRTSIFACPAIGPDGTIYFGGFNGIFYALKDKGDKPKELWRHEVKSEPYSTASTKYQEFWGSAAIGRDGTIYVGNNDFNVYAFAPDGTVKWKFKTRNEVYQSVTIGGNDTIYIASEDRNLYALNPDGKLKWSKRPIDRGIPFTVAVAEDETIIFGISGRDRIIALDGNTGESKWECIFNKTDSEDGTSNDPVIGPDATVYVYSAGSIHAVKASSPLSTKSPWPKVNKNNINSGRF